MDVELPAGKYVVAVSGGVDSVVLLHLLAQGATKSQSNPKTHATYHLPPTTYQLIVAHFDHGIRPDSDADRQFVQELAAACGLPFVYERAELGAGASEAVARNARYDFLRRVKDEHQAEAIVTAHHQDDVLETIIINWLRGTKSRGLSSLRSTPEIRRPLLGWSKQQIRAYAHLHTLQWREDSTNEDETYLRNYVRRQIIPKISAKMREQLLVHSERAASLNDAISAVTNEYLAAHTTPTS
ncbi:MAG: tRNA lysidine(34) synthetase TilS, partial [Candidatus Doudnabacteria bacterium]|nr:tRNA lysidine(34) synthetase TilS [Candidatus Doudnabacteria bacterium]